MLVYQGVGKPRVLGVHHFWTLEMRFSMAMVVSPPTKMAIDLTGNPQSAAGVNAVHHGKSAMLEMKREARVRPQSAASKDHSCCSEIVRLTFTNWLMVSNRGKQLQQS